MAIFNSYVKLPEGTTLFIEISPTPRQLLITIMGIFWSFFFFLRLMVMPNSAVGGKLLKVQLLLI